MRSARCSTLCARLPELPSTSFDIAVVVAFAVGLLLFGISTAMLRKPAALNPSWPQLIDESLVSADRQLRLDMIERLSIIAQPWCEDVLRQAIEQEDDAAVRDAILVAVRDLRKAQL